MSLYRGAGGASDATDDSTVNAVAGYASSAASSASAAAASATTATNNATAAATSASQAASSTSTAATSASNAATSASNAAASASSASSSASSASTSATNASNSAGTASTYASEALGYRNTASTHATNAASSASAAAGSATSAANSAASALAIYGNTAAMEEAVADAVEAAATAQQESQDASDSAVAAAASEALAFEHEQNAAEWATTAQGSANNAQTYATSALAARDATLQAYDNFDDRYLGTKSSDPTVDNDGNPLIAGSLYFNDQTNRMMLYAGGNWVAAYTSGGSPSFGDTVVNGTLQVTGNTTLSGGTANGVAYLNGSKVLTTGSALTFDGTTLATTGKFSGALNGTVGATTPSTGAFTTLSTTGNTTLGDASTDTVTVNGYMGVGGAGQANIGAWIRNTLIASSFQYGLFANITAGSGAATLVSGVAGDVTVPDAAFTYAEVATLYAPRGTKGAAATVTSWHGLKINDQTQGTNNYGITSLVSSGTNKWNIYASGTASNYFAGNVFIGGTTSPSRLHVQTTDNSASKVNGIMLGNLADGSGKFLPAIDWGYGAGTPIYGSITALRDTSVGGALALFTAQVSTGTVTERMRIDSSGNVGIGGASTGGKVEVTTDTATSWNALQLINTAESSTIDAYFGRSNVRRAFIRAITGTTAAGSPTALAFGTNAGGQDGVERMRIDTAGNVLVGLTSATGVAKLQVSGPLRTTGYTVATLPAGTVGMRTYVTDALAPSFGATVVAGGAVTIPVFYNGTNWIVG